MTERRLAVKPFYCDECKGIVPSPYDRWVITEDALRNDGKKRAYRIRLTTLCTEHMQQREKMERPSEVKGQESLFPQ